MCLEKLGITGTHKSLLCRVHLKTSWNKNTDISHCILVPVWVNNFALSYPKYNIYVNSNLSRVTEIDLNAARMGVPITL